MIYPHALECIIFEGIENARSKTAEFNGHTIRFDWIDDPETRNTYAVADSESREWYTIVNSTDDKGRILSDIIDALKDDDNAKGFFVTYHISPSGVDWRDVFTKEEDFVTANLGSLQMGYILLCRDKRVAIFKHEVQ